jgi:hypothetical protein
VLNNPEPPVGYEAARAWASSKVWGSGPLVDVRHAELEADQQAGGFAFVDSARRLIIIGRDGSGYGVALARDDDAERAGHIDAWLARSRHRHRPLTLAELGPWQQAAAAAYLAGVTVGDLPAEQAPATLDSAGVDYAEYLLTRMRRSRSGDPLRALAADDELMQPPDLARWPGSRYTHPCPVCGRPTPHWNRYPRSVCDRCGERAADAAGRFVAGYNTHFSGGFEARYRTRDGRDGDVCVEVSESGRCWIDDHECSIGEARFGGIVIEALPPADGHSA